MSKNKMMNYKQEPDYIIVDGNIKNINNSWKKEVDYYLSENYNELKNKNKYLQSRINIFNNKIDKPPIIEINDDGNITFENGKT